MEVSIGRPDMIFKWYPAGRLSEGRDLWEIVKIAEVGIPCPYRDQGTFSVIILW